MSDPTICIVIPARLNSLRFPRKVLWSFYKIPMIEHVYKRACMALNQDNVYITSGDSEILNYMNSLGAKVLHSSLHNEDGTARAAEIAKNLTYDYIIILQADEILIDPEHLKLLIQDILENRDLNYWNLTADLSFENQIDEIDIVKCALDKNKNILFIFRRNPFLASNVNTFKKIMGTIAFERSSLISLSDLKDSSLQLANSTEQLKILEYGGKIKSVNVDYSYPSINTPSDIYLVRDFLKTCPRQMSILSKYVSF